MSILASQLDGDYLHLLPPYLLSEADMFSDLDSDGACSGKSDKSDMFSGLRLATVDNDKDMIAMPSPPSPTGGNAFICCVRVDFSKFLHCSEENLIPRSVAKDPPPTGKPEMLQMSLLRRVFMGFQEAGQTW